MTMLSDVPIDQIIVGDRARKDVGHMGGLQASIEVLGLLHPLVLNSRHELVAGFRRLTAVKLIGWKTVPCMIVGTLDDAIMAMRAELHENICREPMRPTEAIELGKRIEAIEKPEAKRRQKDHGGTAPGKPLNTSGKLPEVKKGDTRDKVAAAVGISGKTYDKIKQVAEAAEKEPEKFGDLPAMMDEQSVDAAHKELRKRGGSKPREKKPSSPSPGVPQTQTLIPCEPNEPNEPAAPDWKQSLDLALTQLCDTFDALSGPPNEIATALRAAANRLLAKAADLEAGH